MNIIPFFRCKIIVPLVLIPFLEVSITLAFHSGHSVSSTTSRAPSWSKISSATPFGVLLRVESSPLRYQARPEYNTPTRLYLERKMISHHHHDDHNNPPPITNRLARSPHHGNNSTELSASFADVARMGYKIFCDLDGVLVDFDQGVQRLLHCPPSKLIKGTMWKHIARANAFYEHLPWTVDGKKLWKAIRPLQPDILTGVPYPKSSRVEKYNWCRRELGLDELNHVDMAAGCKDHECVNGSCLREGVTNIITCWSNNKHYESRYGA